jgi:peptidoglycan/xylan/chitin deacetylase (PgdA/CDA1 family)
MTWRPGAFIISLDFELYWGVRDALPLDRYRDNLLGARAAIPQMLALFDEFDVHATWATVGFLFFDRRDALLEALPSVRPDYRNPSLSPYPFMAAIGPSEESDPFHFGRSLIEEIRRHPGQEIATHTFSHFYCLEAGGATDAFRADLEAALRVARAAGIEIRTIIFPRNQVSAAHLHVCGELGLIAYRGTQRGWAYQPSPTDSHPTVRRAFRLVDAYVNLSGEPNAATDSLETATMVNVPASRFLRPYSPRLRKLEHFKERRITHGMTFAARHGLMYHLWWHPHNFGRHTTENMSGLRRILSHFAQLRDRWDMRSLSMAEFAHQAHHARPGDSAHRGRGAAVARNQPVAMAAPATNGGGR